HRRPARSRPSRTRDTRGASDPRTAGPPPAGDRCTLRCRTWWGRITLPAPPLRGRGNPAEIVTTDVTVVDSSARARGAPHRGRSAHGAARGPGHASPGA